MSRGLGLKVWAQQERARKVRELTRRVQQNAARGLAEHGAKVRAARRLGVGRAHLSYLLHCDTMSLTSLCTLAMAVGESKPERLLQERRGGEATQET